MDSVNTNAGMTPADIAAVMKNDKSGGAWWLLVLFLFMFGMGGGNWNRNNAPLNADIQRGFDQNTVQNMMGGLQGAIGAGFANAATARDAAQMALQNTLSQNQLNTQGGFNNIAMALQGVGSQNQAGISDLKFTIAQENCADRQAVNNGIRDLMAQNTQNTNAIVQSQQQGFQSIQDKLCALQIENLKQTNEQLRQALNMATLSASQTRQTSQLMADNAAQTAALIQRIAPAPTPAYIVANPNASTSTS